ncbi:hypothetical protein ABT075_13905 [Streptomyces sp. NPDC002677]|uniref:hypothetical protein n=1 Tax=Streptomyces sp. NPDC002677 TaxID=3154774 RepID=UPI0033200617
MRSPLPVGALLRRLRLPLGNPLHILLLACSFALAAYAGVRLLSGDWLGVTLWVVGAALLHDLVLLPLYSLADRAAVRGLGAAGRRVGAPLAPLGPRGRAMYVRVPAALSALLLLVWFPLISGMVAGHYRTATGLSSDGYLARWLLITAVLFGGSALLLVCRLRRATKRRPPAAH